MSRLAKVLDEDPNVANAGVNIVRRMIDEEKIHHLHAAEAEAGRQADRDRKKVVKKDSQYSNLYRLLVEWPAPNL
jgi:hypothetical protein